METTFKKGDRVRLKAYVAPRRASVICALFEQGWVGIVEDLRKWSKGVVVLLRHLHNTESPSAPFGQSFVYVEDLELMPEKQVHVVKDGKVYELRKKEPSLPSCNSCDIMTSPYTCRTPCPGYYNYKEVKSGKLVS